MTDSESDLKEFTCAVCLEIFDKPCMILCGHIFCRSCMEQYKIEANPACPVCRTEFNPRHIRSATDVERQMRSTIGACSGCSKQMKLSHLRAHMAACSSLSMVEHTFKPVAKTSQTVPHDLPNRQTFLCPYCSQKNLDYQSLAEHCRRHHSGERSDVVCPICASMPWGDSTQRSGNFLQHLNLRHKFEYDTYVDYEQDDDMMLQAALEASVQDR